MHSLSRLFSLKPWKLRHPLTMPEYQDCPFSAVFLTIKTLSQNVSITLLHISLKPHVHRGGCWRKKLPWTSLEEKFPVPSNTAASTKSYSVFSLLWQLRCYCNPDHNKFSSLSNTTVVAIFPNLCLWRRSFCSNLGDTDPEKLYRATLSAHAHVIVSSPDTSITTCAYILYKTLSIKYTISPIYLHL